MKDREKEEYTFGIRRERNPQAERFLGQRGVEGSFGVDSLNQGVSENGRSRYRS